MSFDCNRFFGLQTQGVNRINDCFKFELTLRGNNHYLETQEMRPPGIVMSNERMLGF